MYLFKIVFQISLKCRTAISVAVSLQQGKDSSFEVYRQLSCLNEGCSWLRKLKLFPNNLFASSLLDSVRRMVSNKHKNNTKETEAIDMHAYCLWAGVCTALDVCKMQQLMHVFKIQLYTAAAQINPEAIHKCLCDFTTSRIIRAAGV